ncbi:hypothetical protein [Nostoc sp. WHI]|uniref:hypothetical protein n=1 Tax=Nostoc sp. WHI TaxID=2650611 RepID=UPI0018C8345E|nr:hypothetical protein [Nostoc sp. WHI]
MPSGICAIAAVTINLSIRKMRELAGFKLIDLLLDDIYVQPCCLRFSVLGVI